MKLVFKREKDLINLGGKIDIYVNGDFVDFINFNENEKIVNVNYDVVEVFAKVQWCQSNRVKIEKDKEIIFKVGYRIKGFLKILIIFGIILFLFLTLTISFNFFYLVCFSLVYPLYLITLGRKQFLELNVLE